MRARKAHKTALRSENREDKKNATIEVEEATPLIDVGVEGKP
jgi:hypothetical protein